VAVTFMIPGHLRAFTAGRTIVSLDASPATAGEALAALWAIHPGVRDRVVTEQGEVRPHVNVFVGDESIRWTGGLDTPVREGAEISIVPAVSGGADPGD
jgi:molybdopterin converting factor small subunit